MKIFIIIFLNIISISLLAQDVVSIPKHEFNISLSNDKLELKQGEKKDIVVTLLRSKSFSKLNSVMGLSSTLPDGVHIAFEQASGIMDSTQAHISIDENAKPGNHTIIINCTMNHKNKGAMLKLIIAETSAAQAGL